MIPPQFSPSSDPREAGGRRVVQGPYLRELRCLDLHISRPVGVIE